MQFRNEYWFLSNMFAARIQLVIAGQLYLFSCSEAAFQAAKCPSQAARFTKLDGFQAKAEGKKVPLVPNWNAIRVDVMRVIVKAKFDQHPQLMRKLRAISGEIAEYNTWGDDFWGMACKPGREPYGQNHLGKILMEVRDYQN